MLKTIKERPILFSGPMVRAILAGRKTQTRRIVKPQPPAHAVEVFDWRRPDIAESVKANEGCYFADHDGLHFNCKCPYGQVGDRLWVRETWASELLHIVGYKAGGEAGAWMGDGAGGRLWVHHGYILEAPGYPFGLTNLRTFGLAKYGGKWRPSIHMPRWASRITLEITGVRVERLNDISHHDALQEGLIEWTDPPRVSTLHYGLTNADVWETNAPAAFKRLWESINGAGSWAANPWVWVVEFTRL